MSILYDPLFDEILKSKCYLLCCNVVLIYFIFLSHVNFQTIRAVELILHDKLDSMRSKHLPPIKRGGEIDIYFTSSGQQEQ